MERLDIVLLPTDEFDWDIVGEEEERANPYHSKKNGQFASKNGGVSGAKAGPLSPEQWAAITPGKGKKAIAARKEMDKTPAGRQLKDTTNRWQNDMSQVTAIQKGFMLRANGKKVTARQEADSTALMHGIKGSPVTPPIYRGIRVAPGDIANYQKGKAIILPPSSFTSSERIGAGFAKQNVRGNVVPVLIRAKAARGLPVEVYGDSEYKNEKEWISAGQFTVTGVSKRSDGVHVIDVEHTAMFQW